MSYFFSLRAWLEVEPEKFQTAIRLIESLQHTHEQNTKIGLYLQGWSWNKRLLIGHATYFTAPI